MVAIVITLPESPPTALSSCRFQLGRVRALATDGVISRPSFPIAKELAYVSMTYSAG